MFVLSASMEGSFLLLPGVDWVACYRAYLRPFLIWSILAGLIIKLVLLPSLVSMSWRRCGVALVAINLASSGLDIVTIPLAGLTVMLLELPFGVEKGSAFEWLPIVLVLTMIHASSEASVLHFAFKEKIGKRGFWLLVLANAICLGVGCYGMALYERTHQAQAINFSSI